jgi:DNA invertase Pin-like site-specific DNA recombinase
MVFKDKEKALLYIRTSTGEQTPELQIKDCQTLAERLGLQITKITEDKVSGWKDVERENFENVKQAIQRKEIQHLIVWDLDRIYRNRKKLIAFFEFCKIYSCQIHSFRQNWLDTLNSIPEPFNEIMHSTMLQIMGWLAEDESNKKSDRIRLAVRKEDGKPTKSYKGNKWGRKTILTDRLISDILKLRTEGKSIRTIKKEVYAYDKNNNKIPVSVATIHSVLHNPVQKTSQRIQQEKPINNLIS